MRDHPIVWSRHRRSGARVKRREFIALVGGAVAWPMTAYAQQPVKMPRIGFLVTAPFDTPEFREARDPFLQGMRELGYVEGQNIIIEYRSAEGKQERFTSLANDLVRDECRPHRCLGDATCRAAQQATRTIPIVVPVMSDPVGDGLVASLARPGGNITGLTSLAPELTPKMLDLLSQALPGISRVAALWHPAPPARARRARPGRLPRQRQPVCVCSFDGWRCLMRTTSTAPSTALIASGPRPCSWSRARCSSPSGDASPPLLPSTGCRRSSMPGNMRRSAAS